MLEILGTVSTVLWKIITLGGIAKLFVPNMYGLASALSILIVYAVFTIVLSSMGYKNYVDVNKGLESHEYKYFSVYKSLQQAETLKKVIKVGLLYVLLCGIYIAISSLLRGISGYLIIDLIWIVVMVVSAFVMTCCACLGRPVLPFMDNIGSVRDIINKASIAILVCKVVADVIFKSPYVDYLPLLAILLVVRNFAHYRSEFSYGYSDTKKYFAEKNATDTYIKDELSFELMLAIAKDHKVLGDLNDKDKETLNEVLKLPSLEENFKGIPHKIYTNDEYYDMIEEMKKDGINHVVSKDEVFGDTFYKRVANTIEEVQKENYFVDCFETEGIVKLFDAIGYKAEPTPENYVKLRRTIEIISLVYGEKVAQQASMWRELFDKEYPTIANGVEGERRVIELVNSIKEKNPGMEVLTNFRFKYANGTPTECDLIIISTRGIFCIEVKNYGQDGNYDIEITPDGVWHKRYGDKLIDYGSDPVQQNAMHAEALVMEFGEVFKKLTGDGTIPEVKQFVVVANDINFVNSSTNLVLHLNGIESYLTNFVVKYDKNTVMEVADSLRAANDPSKGHDFIDFMSWNKEINAVNKVYLESISAFRNMRISEKYRIMR